MPFLLLLACASDGKARADSAESAPPVETGESGGTDSHADSSPGDTADSGEGDADGDGWSVATGDCDDTDQEVSPDARERCGNAVDDDCDGVADDGCGPVMSVEGAVTYTGEVDGDLAGWAVGGGGDVNGDGFDDLVIGAQCNGLPCIGAAYLVLGGAEPGSMSLSGAIKYAGESNYDYAASSVAMAGDVDADGYDDVVIGAPGNLDAGYFSGVAYIVRGSATPASANLGDTLALDGGWGDEAGSDVDGAGDVDGDGLADVVIGAYASSAGSYFAGAAYVLLGRDSLVAGSLADTIPLVGTNALEYAGTAVAGAGDVDGDGLGDVLVGAHQAESESGAAYLQLGSELQAGGNLSDAIRFVGDGSRERFGMAVAGAGDVNGDGRSDLLIGAMDNSDGGYVAGAVFLVLGSGTPAADDIGDAVKYLGVEGDFVAWVSGAQDVDADGFDDFLVSAWLNQDSTSGGGAVYVMFGESAPGGGDLAGRPTVQGASDDHLGLPSSGGDVDADGIPDLLLGARRQDEGRAYMVLGPDVLSLAGR